MKLASTLSRLERKATIAVLSHSKSIYLHSFIIIIIIIIWDNLNYLSFHGLHRFPRRCFTQDVSAVLLWLVSFPVLVCQPLKHVAASQWSHFSLSLSLSRSKEHLRVRTWGPAPSDADPTAQFWRIKPSLWCQVGAQQPSMRQKCSHSSVKQKYCSENKSTDSHFYSIKSKKVLLLKCTSVKSKN